MSDTLRVSTPRHDKAETYPAESAMSLPRQFDMDSKEKQSDKHLPAVAPPLGPPPQIHRLRQNLAHFLFNPGRQDLIGALLTGYPQAPQSRRHDLSFPSYYMGREPMEPRLRGDSVFLPPPMSTKHDESAAANSALVNGMPAPLRSNSIFSLLIQLPPSTKNSVSEGLGKRYLEFGDFDASKESLSNLFGWDLRRSKGQTDPVSLISNDLLNAFLTQIQNSGSVDFSNMSYEQRRDLILKFLEQNQDKTPLREDIFERRRVGEMPQVPEGTHLSPTSSMLLKLLHRFREEPQLPKTLPGGLQKAPAVYDTLKTYAPELFGYAKREFQQPSPPLNARAPYSQPLFKSNAYMPEEEYKELDKLDKNYQYGMGRYMDGELVPAQNYARAEDGRPLLGATKVDQLMLVIQAREKGNTNAIQQASDGSILGTLNRDKDGVLPQAVDLVGGIEKPLREDEGDAKRKKKLKNQRCPYCLKYFNQLTHLEVHVRLHIGYKPFQCSFCLKRFTQGGNLRTHMRLHTGEKPFTCEVCKRSFSRKGNLAAHMLTHKKEKPFECKLDGCDKSFTQLGNLKLHQNKFHLPTLNRLTQSLAELSGDALENLPPEEKDLLDYFRKLYKNLNKGIRGRGRGKKVAPVAEEEMPLVPLAVKEEPVPLDPHYLERSGYKPHFD